MKSEVTNTISPDITFWEERNMKRFKKAKKDKKISYLSCTETENGQDFHFREYGYFGKVTNVEIHLFDSTGTVHLLTPDHNSFRGINVYFLSDRKILIAYELHEEERIHFCSWGYKNSNSGTEKLFIYFKTDNSAYLAYADAESPEYPFLLMDDDSEGYNPVQNLYRFLQKYLRKDCEIHESLS